MRSDDLNVHRRVLHTREKLACTDCDKKYMRMSDLRRHRRIHTGEKPFACLECDEKFVRSDELIGHRRLHTDEKPYVCPDCEKTFKHLGSLNMHRRNHTSKENKDAVDLFKLYGCGICCQSYSTKEETIHCFNSHCDLKDEQFVKTEFSF